MRKHLKQTAALNKCLLSSVWSEEDLRELMNEQNKPSPALTLQIPPRSKQCWRDKSSAGMNWIYQWHGADTQLYRRARSAHEKPESSGLLRVSRSGLLDV